MIYGRTVQRNFSFFTDSVSSGPDAGYDFHPGEEKRARRLHNIVVLAQMYERSDWTAFSKYLLIKRGVIRCGALRETTPLLDKEASGEIDRIYQELEPYFTVRNWKPKTDGEMRL